MSKPRRPVPTDITEADVQRLYAPPDPAPALQPRIVTGIKLDNEEYMRERQVAQHYGIPLGRLQKWRQDRTGIPFYKRGAWVYYKRTEVEKYLAEHASVVHFAPQEGLDEHHRA